MTNLEIAKQYIKKYVDSANCGIYCTRNITGDPMHNLYNNNGLVIDICYGYSYFEVFGLKDEEFEELKEFYYFST